MRISMSLLLAALVSFALLTVMARLVTVGEMPAAITLPTLAGPDLLPPAPTPTKPPRAPAPDKPTVKATPATPQPILPPVDGSETGPKLPPFSPGNPVREGWPGHGTPGIGDPTGVEPGGTEPGIAEPASNLIPLSQIQPLYPREQAAKGVEGWVSLRFLVQPDGRVSEVRIVASSPRRAFETAALAAVGKWRYRAHKGGPITQTVTLEFRLDE